MNLNKLLIIAAALALTACGKGDSTTDTSTRPVLAVSVAPQAAILDELAGDRFDVVTIITPGSNPETFEPSMSVRRDLDAASAYFTTGHLPFEAGLTGVLPEGVKIVDTSIGITPVFGTHGHDHNHGDGHHDHGDNADPHIWASVRNARTIAANMAAALAQIDPAGADIYTARLARLTARMDSLDRAWTDRLSAPDVHHSFAIWHPSLSYMARDYGLEQVAVGFENKEPSASHLASIINEAREDGVRVLFMQREYDSRQATNMSREIGARMVTINPMAYDWEAQLDSIVSALCR